MTGEYWSVDVQEFVRTLHRHDVRYVVVGGEAVIFHGYPRLTGDVDFFYDRTPSNAGRLFAALEEFWGGRVPEVASAQELLEAEVIIQFGRPPNRIDLLGDIGSVSFDEAWANRVTEPLRTEHGDVPLHIIGLEQLLQSKRDAGRHKDLDDIEHLEPSD